MTTSDDGGPAFPVEVSDDGEGGIKGRQTGSSSGFSMGMSLRDWFAGQALIGMLHYDSTAMDLASPNASRARDAYVIADAMLAARKGTT